MSSNTCRTLLCTRSVRKIRRQTAWSMYVAALEVTAHEFLGMGAKVRADLYHLNTFRIHYAVAKRLSSGFTMSYICIISNRRYIILI